MKTVDVKIYSFFLLLLRRIFNHEPHEHSRTKRDLSLPLINVQDESEVI